MSATKEQINGVIEFLKGEGRGWISPAAQLVADGSFGDYAKLCWERFMSHGTEPSKGRLVQKLLALGLPSGPDAAYAVLCGETEKQKSPPADGHEHL